jgi:hypothetical protein
MGKTLFIGLTAIWLIGCGPTYNHSGDYEAALSRQATVTKVSVDNHALTQEEIARSGDLGKPWPLPNIIVTAGPLSQPYTALGEVNINTKGMINLGSILNDTLFRSPLQRAVQGPTPTAHTETMNKMLREKAREQYGSQVDAVVNVVYRTDPDGDVFASGLAVHFAEPTPAPTLAPQVSTLEQKLTELKSLREKNLITPEEYSEKRSKLLEGL